MAYFPLFMDLENKKCLMIGGNKHILEKVEKLLPYGPVIEVVAETFDDGFQDFDGIKLTKGSFTEAMLDDRDIVFVSMGHTENSIICEMCRKRRIPVNSVDDIDNCDFIVPSLIKRGPLSIGISTSGYSPAAAVYLKDRFNEMLPDDLDVILDYMNSKREDVMKHFPDFRSRSFFFKRLFSECFTKGRILSESEYQDLIG